MAVSIDPSEVRPQGAPAARPAGSGSRARLLLTAVLGGAGLVAFSLAAFSFFSGLADPRVRLPLPRPAQAQMPEIRDGVPALAADVPAVPTPAGARPEAPAAQPVPALRASLGAEVPPADVPRQPVRRAPPTIQNAAVVAETRTAEPIPPGSAETVRAKPGQPAAFVSLPPEPKTAEPKTAESKAVENKAVAARPVEPRPTETRAARPEPRIETRSEGSAEVKPTSGTKARGTETASARAAARPTRVVARAPAPSHPTEAVTEAVPPPAADDGEVLGVPVPGGRQLKAGIKAIGGLFGGSDSEAD